MQQAKVRKRNGRTANIDFKKIQNRINRASKGLNVDILKIATEVVQGIYDGVSTVELDRLIADTAATYALDHPDYQKLAGQIAVSTLHKDTVGDFEKTTNSLIESKLLREDYIERCKEYGLANIASRIDYLKDYKLDYFGYKTLEKSYLLKSPEKDGVSKILERPQDLYMRVAITVTENFEEAVETYKRLSNWKYSHATPTLFNSGLKNQQLASCFLLNNKGDNKEAILSTLTDTAVISAGAGGLGISISNFRGAGSAIHSSGGVSNGLMPMLRTYNEIARWWDQGGGKRKGSFAMYLEPWHIDILTFLDIKKNHGKEELRARDLFPALWIPDLFMEKVESDGDWCVTCPNEQLKAGFTRLDELHGEEFNREYSKIFEKVSNREMSGKIIKAQLIWAKILESQIETGTPYMLYKDSANSKSNHRHLGTIKSSNLCTEIIEYTSSTEQAVCNLASLNLSGLIVDGKVDFEDLYETTKIAVRNLNTVIDRTTYPTPETEYSNLRHRPMGLGVQGLADLFAQLKIPYTSEKAKKINAQIFEVIYKAALDTSCEIAKVDGPYESFKDSPMSKGELQFDYWNRTQPLHYTEEEWNKTRANVVKYGVRNSLFLAPMPTASTAQIMGNTEAFEPFKSNMFTRKVISGDFNVVNKYMVKDLEDLGLWSSVMKNEIIAANGSIQHIERIPRVIKDRYPTVYEISMRDIIDMAADRGAFIDQSQSMNLWMEDASFGKLTSMHMYAWKKGLKTGMYYLRTKAAAEPLKSLGIDNTLPEKPSDSYYECDGCGS